MIVKIVIQRVTAILVFLTGLIFGILGIFGVNLMVNQTDINGIIFGLGSVIAVLIEFIPSISKLVKDGKLKELLSIVNDVVYAVEESKTLTGEQKKQKAMQSIENICNDRGIEFNSIQVSMMIESVIDIYNTVVKS